MEIRKNKILAIDDNQDNLITLKALIKEAFPDSDTLTALNGTKGIELASSEDPDVILLDIIMPGIDGFEVCKKLKEDKKLNDIPVVFVTAIKGDKELRIRALESGAEAFLSKPIDESELKAIIRAMLKIKKSNSDKHNENERLNNLVSVRTHQLRLEIEERRQTEEKIRKLNEELEKRVIERTEELENANKELESFSYSISHDLRAPLRAINGFSSILLEDYSEKLDEEGQRLFNIIRDNAKKMSDLIDDLLTFSRINKYEIKKSEIDMKTMAEFIYNEVTHEEERKNISFSVYDLAKTKADPAMIRQIWVNLISNAVKFTSKKENPKIEIGYKAEDGKNIYFIKDNGAGFDMKYYDKIFEVFQRLHTDSEYKGTGVGLSIVKSIIAKHGGKIWAESELNVGTTFFFCLEEGSRQ